MNNKKLIILIALAGMLAVIFGAFGAHLLKAKLTASSLSAYQTGVQYQFYHSLAALIAFLLYQHHPSQYLKNSILSFLIGILLFSGSIYLLSTKDLHNLPGISLLGPITPIGGIFFILGWLCIGVAFLKPNK